MEELWNFINRIRAWLLFAVYVLISCILIFRGNVYHQSVYLTSANRVVTTLQGGINAVTDYFNLRKANEDLMLSNAMLENKVLNLQQQLADLSSQRNDSLDVDLHRFSFVPASVVNNNTRLPNNFFTINKGSADGVKPGMGVVDHNGIVGIVNVTGPHTARVISVLNSSQHFSAMIKDTEAFGSLSWHGRDPKVAYLEEIPRHIKFHPGDTVVTSGASTTFPQGIAIGRVVSRVRGADDNSFTLKVRLMPDFANLKSVRVITDLYKQELDSLQQFDFKEE